MDLVRLRDAGGSEQIVSKAATTGHGRKEAWESDCAT